MAARCPDDDGAWNMDTCVPFLKCQKVDFHHSLTIWGVNFKEKNT